MTIILKNRRAGVSEFHIKDTQGAPKTVINLTEGKYALTSWDIKNKKAIYKEVIPNE